MLRERQTEVITRKFTSPALRKGRDGSAVAYSPGKDEGVVGSNTVPTTSDCSPDLRSNEWREEQEAWGLPRGLDIQTRREDETSRRGDRQEGLESCYGF